MSIDKQLSYNWCKTSKEECLQTITYLYLHISFAHFLSTTFLKDFGDCTL